MRDGLRKARKKMGVTIERLADLLRWDVRKLKGALDKSPGRALRATTAMAIFDRLELCGPEQVPGLPRHELRSRSAAVTTIVNQLVKESPTLRKWVSGDPEELARTFARARRADLAAVIVPERIRDVAEDLADEVTRTPGVKPRIRVAIAENLENALRRRVADYAHSAYNTLRENGIDDPTARRVLAVLGWSIEN